MVKRIRYNVVGFYPEHNCWCLIYLGSFDKEQMQKILEDVKSNPEKHNIKPEQVTEYKLNAHEESGSEWWNGNLN